MKYVLIDDCGTELFTSEYDSHNDAIIDCDRQFQCLTTADKKRRKGFYLLESVNPDALAVDHYDGEIVRRWI